VVATAGREDVNAFPSTLSYRLSKSSSSLLYLKSISKSPTHLASTAISLFISCILYTQPPKIFKYFGPHLIHKAVGLIDNSQPKDLIMGLRMLESL
jgi:hypothetical protein